MPRPFTRRQARENAAFLDQLRRTGNARLAARALGAHRAKFTKRRARHAAFAAQWEMALAACHAAMTLGGGARPPEGKSDALRTQGGEPCIVRLKSGRLQLRLAPPGRMTKAAEQAFFRALAASANVKLSAAAAGFSYGSFYARKYTRPAFAREMRLALKMAWERLECVLLAASLPESWEDDAWRTRDAGADPADDRRPGDPAALPARQVGQPELGAAPPPQAPRRALGDLYRAAARDVDEREGAGGGGRRRQARGAIRDDRRLALRGRGAAAGAAAARSW